MPSFADVYLRNGAHFPWLRNCGSLASQIRWLACRKQHSWISIAVTPRLMAADLERAGSSQRLADLERHQATLMTLLSLKADQARRPARSDLAGASAIASSMIAARSCCLKGLASFGIPAASP